MQTQSSFITNSTKFIIYLCLSGISLYIILVLYDYFASLGLEYEWQWNRTWRFFGKWTKNGFEAGPLFKGFLLTIGIGGTALCFSIIIGLIISAMKLSPWRSWRFFSIIYIASLRNTPLLLQLFFTYFLLSPIFNINPFWTAVLSLSAFEGAYFAEIFRGAILSIPRAQWEGSLSLGFNIFQTLIFIILPQAVRSAIPALSGQAVALIKDTSLVSAIAVADITMQAQAIIAETFMAFEVWLLVALIYLVLNLCITIPGLMLEKFDSRHY